MILTYANGHAKAVMCDWCLQICAPCFDCNTSIPATQIIIDDSGNLHRTYDTVHTDGYQHICHECFSAEQNIRKYLPTDVFMTLAKQNNDVHYVRKRIAPYSLILTEQINKRRAVGYRKANRLLMKGHLV